MSTDKITFLTNWQATPYHAPLYLAQSKGYFADEGIKVALLEPNDPSDVTEIIGSGKVDLGFKAMIHTLAASARGFPVTSIGSLLNEPFTGVVYLSSSGMTPDFTTLKGKKIGYVGDPRTMYTAVRVGMNVTKRITNGDMDAGIGLENRSRDQVKMLRIDELAQLGCCCFCSILYIGHDASIAANRDKVRALLRACKRATDFVLALPDPAWNEFTDFKPGMDSPTHRKIFERSFAYFSPDMQNVLRDWEKVTRYGKRLGVVDGAFVPNCTNEYLEWGLEEDSADPTRMVVLLQRVKVHGGFKRLEELASKTIVGAEA
ncbi:NMT1-domain-containing protein [Lizonia empirigonia]|nr:NMT1-domain-containing protein [Lizonia empirigonia]